MGISQRKMDANRKNAQASTGPRTEAGKKRSRWNAVKDGLTAKTVVVPGWEDPKEFKKLVRALVKYYKPKGPVEKGYIQDLAVCQLKLQRALRVERNEFRRVADSALEDALDEALEKVDDKKDAEEAEKEVRKRDFLNFPLSDSMPLVLRYDARSRRDRDRILNALEKAQRLRGKKEK